MATTTASVSISSSDLQVGNQLSINASSTLMQTGLTTGLEIMEMGGNTLTVAASAKAIHEGGVVLADRDQAAYVYLCNKATDDAYYIIVRINATTVGHLYAGDWMFIPYAQGDNVAELNITATNGTCDYEYAIYSTIQTLIDATS